jgi:hypothetical protein
MLSVILLTIVHAQNVTDEHVLLNVVMLSAILSIVTAPKKFYKF